MDGLRWLLLLVGLFVVAGVYLYTRFQRGNIEGAAEEAADQVSGAEIVPAGASGAAQRPARRSLPGARCSPTGPMAGRPA